MTQLTLDSVVLVPVVCIRLSLHPLLPCRVVFDLGLSRIELSLSMLELLEVHVLNTVSAKSQILGVRKSECARDQLIPHGLLSCESLLSYVRQALLHQIFNELLTDGRSRWW